MAKLQNVDFNVMSKVEDWLNWGGLSDPFDPLTTGLYVEFSFNRV